MKFVQWLMVLGLMTTAVACGGGTTPEGDIDETAPATEDTEMMDEEQPTEAAPDASGEATPEGSE